eukprot:m.271700 g.271700  ORF g.271700 m.271700 type:complete len:295 (+) comp15683_c18_seq4:183-1067(+)
MSTRDNGPSGQLAYKPPIRLPIETKLGTAAAAGVVGTICVFPLDSVKTRLQSGGFPTMRAAARDIWTRSGPAGFYKGLMPNLVGVTPEKAIKLVANEIFREKFGEMERPLKLWEEMVAGAGAGACQMVATTPMELVKIQMQMQNKLPVNERQTTMQVVRSLGFRGLYSGGVATLCRDVPFSFMFFPLYANLKKAFSEPDGTTPFQGVLAAGCIAGGVTAALNTPADVIKTRLQLKGGIARYRNVQYCFKTILKHEGWGALYSGWFPRMVVVAPLFGISLLAFEKQKEWLANATD